MSSRLPAAWAHMRVDTATGAVDPHLLEDHLLEVARSAAKSAVWGAADWAYLAGLWHDLGKYRPGFRRYIRQANGVDAHIEGRVKDVDKTHSAAGALWAERLLAERCGKQGRLMSRVLQYVVAGHHAGLENWEGCLATRLARTESACELEEALATDPPPDILTPASLALRWESAPIANESTGIPGRFALWVRMLFSALVDADFLDTERFLNQPQSSARSGAPVLASMKDALDQHMAAVARGAANSLVNHIRGDVLAQCRHKALLSPGAFTLTVPTGGGKTLASLSFALHHAVRHGKRRVVYAIPYTTIIEQTADVFRSVFAALGDDVVIEHHSNAEVDPDRETSRSRLACENWDAPLVVTTNVQLFESLFARRTSRCRKLHNLAGSVLVLDEAQLLPVEFLQPIVDVLQLLVRDYGVTLLLCTATQPELGPSMSTDPTRGLRRGFEPAQITEIVDDVPALYSALQRVRVHLAPSLDAPRTWPDLADELLQHDALLAVVSRRADARELFNLLRQRDVRGCRHLSALMCAQHRSDVIADVKAALQCRRDPAAAGAATEPVRLVSTQLVECGVDLDFPVVYRALAGLDSIAQSAGRCNREGRLASLGDVHVFVPPTAAPPGLLRQARDVCKTVWHDRPTDPFALDLFQRYFRRLYHDARTLDSKGICEALRLQIEPRSMALAVRFRDASDDFRLIDEADSATVLVRYHSPRAAENIDALIGALERDGPSRWLMRKLQRYGVTIYRHQIARLIATLDIREVPACPGMYVQVEGSERFYDAVLGANVGGAPGDPAAYIA